MLEILKYQQAQRWITANGSTLMNQQSNSIECSLIKNAYDINLISNSISHCCKYQDGYEPKKYEIERLGYKIFDNNPTTIRSRTEIENNIKTASCRDCWEYESQGQPSWRLIKNRDRVQNPEAYDASMAINVQVSSLCNQSCMYCVPVLSSTIAQFGQWIDFNNGQLISSSKEPKEINIKFSHIIDFVDNLPLTTQKLVLSITGGEPFIMNQFEEDIEQIIKAFVVKDKTRQLTLQLSTNGNSKEEVLLNFYNRIEKLQREYNINIEIGLSLENIEERAEYIRQGMKWNNFLNSFNIHKKFANVNIKPTFNVFSVVNIVDFVKLFASQNVHIIYGTVNQKFFRMNILDKSFISELQRLEEYIIQNEKGFYFKDFSSLKDFITDDKENAKIFKPAITDLDNIRKTDWTQVFPEYQQWFNNI